MVGQQDHLQSAFVELALRLRKLHRLRVWHGMRASVDSQLEGRTAVRREAWRGARNLGRKRVGVFAGQRRPAAKSVGSPLSGGRSKAGPSAAKAMRPAKSSVPFCGVGAARPASLAAAFPSPPPRPAVTAATVSTAATAAGQPVGEDHCQLGDGRPSHGRGGCPPLAPRRPGGRTRGPVQVTQAEPPYVTVTSGPGVS